MVRDMRLGDPVRGRCADPCHHAPKITHELSIERRERTAHEHEPQGVVVQEEWVCVLQEGDKHNPVVHPVMCVSGSVPWERVEARNEETNQR